MPEDRRLAAIMFTDIVGYTALMGSDEDKAFEVLRKNREIQRPLIKKYRGEWLKEMGDGILASFHTASDAVRCAGEIQQTAKKEGIGLRIGIHTGEVVFEGHDVLGDGVNVASRLEELAKEGAIIISGAVYKDVKNKAGITAEFIEEKTLKNVDEPVKVYRAICQEPIAEQSGEEITKTSKSKLTYYFVSGLVVVIITILIWQLLPLKKTKSVAVEIMDKSIAVLPFRNDSPDPENEYFCNGMMEEILTHLQRIADMNVKSRTSVEQYRNTTKTIETIAEELNVLFILEGSVRKYGDNFRITAQLIEASTGDHLWAETFDGAYTDTVFIVQANIAKRIASYLNSTITPFERKQIEKSPTSDIRAYEKFIIGRESLNRYWSYSDIKDLKMAENLFRESLEIDPEFAWGYSGMAQIFNIKAERFSKVFWDSVYYYTEKTIEYDQNNGMGYGIKGTYFEAKGDLDNALDSYKKAIEVDPNFPWYYEQIWEIYFIYKRDYRAGTPYIKRAEELTIRQKYQLELFYHRVGSQYLHIGDYEIAKKYFKSSLEINPTCGSIVYYDLLLWIKGEWEKALDFLDSMSVVTPLCSNRANRSKVTIYLFQKEFDQAEQYLNLWVENGAKPSESDSIDIAYMIKEMGREQEALAILKKSRNYFESQLAENGNYWTYLNLSKIYAILDDKEEALKYLSKAAEFGFMMGIHDIIEAYPPFENLRSDPKFKAIVKQAQDEKAAIRAQIREAGQEGEIDL